MDIFLKFSVLYGKKILDTVILRLDKIEKNIQKKCDLFIKTIK